MGRERKKFTHIDIGIWFFFYMIFSHQNQGKQECKYFGAYGIFGLKNDSFYNEI